MGNELYQSRVARDYSYSSSEASGRIDDDDVVVDVRKTKSRRKKLLKFMYTILYDKGSTSPVLITGDTSVVPATIKQASIFPPVFEERPVFPPVIEQGGTYFQIPQFTYKELDEATNHFDIKKKLVDGARASVYQGILPDGRVAAVKRLFEHKEKGKRVEQFMNEIVVLSRLRHQSVVSLYGCTNRYQSELLVVYEYVPNGTLADHLHGNRASDGFLTWPVRLRIAKEIAYALAYLHEYVIHQNFTTDNILLDNRFGVKVAGFGFCSLLPQGMARVFSPPRDTPSLQHYADPELDDKSDVYSFGHVLLELISSKPATVVGRLLNDESHVYSSRLALLVDASVGLDSDVTLRKMITSVAGLAFTCLQQDKDKTPSMKVILETLIKILNE